MCVCVCEKITNFTSSYTQCPVHLINNFLKRECWGNTLNLFIHNVKQLENPKIGLEIRYIFLTNYDFFDFKFF